MCEPHFRKQKVTWWLPFSTLPWLQVNVLGGRLNPVKVKHTYSQTVSHSLMHGIIKYLLECVLQNLTRSDRSFGTPWLTILWVLRIWTYSFHTVIMFFPWNIVWEYIFISELVNHSLNRQKTLASLKSTISPGKELFTHLFQITGTSCDIINQ